MRRQLHVNGGSLVYRRITNDRTSDWIQASGARYDSLQKQGKQADLSSPYFVHVIPSKNIPHTSACHLHLNLSQHARPICQLLGKWEQNVQAVLGKYLASTFYGSQKLLGKYHMRSRQESFSTASRSDVSAAVPRVNRVRCVLWPRVYLNGLKKTKKQEKTHGIG